VYTMRFWIDELGPNAKSEQAMIAQHSMIYVARGEATINGIKLSEGGSIYVDEIISASAGENGAWFWRWGIHPEEKEVKPLPGQQVSSTLKLVRKLKMFELVPTSKWLFRVDHILNFEGSTGQHSIPASGIRCLVEGDVWTVSSKGENSTASQWGDAWYEEGSYPLDGGTSPGVKSTFLRGLIYPPEFEKMQNPCHWIDEVQVKVDAQVWLQNKIITLR
jgi:hypothetical protein